MTPSNGKWRQIVDGEVRKFGVAGHVGTGLIVTPDGCKLVAFKLRKMADLLDEIERKKVTTGGNDV